MSNALTADARLNAALIVTHFCWRELHDLLASAGEARGLDRVLDEEERAQQVLDRGLERIPRSRRLTRLTTRRLELCHERFLTGWRRLPVATRRTAAQAACGCDFRRRGLDPAALLWAVATDPSHEVQLAWPQVVRGCFPEIAEHLDL